MEEVNERAFLFGGKCSADAHHFALRAARVYEDLIGTLRGLKRPNRSLGVECSFDDLLPDGRELFGGDNRCGVFAALDLALIGVLEGGADGDDTARSRHLQLQIGVVGDGHELCVAWTFQDGVVGSMEPDHLEGEGLCPIIGRIPKGDGQINLPKWHGLLSGHDAMEMCSGWADACSVDAHFVERLGIHDVEAAASIHQYFGEPLCADNQVD